MKLNIGCGRNHLDGFINIDKFLDNKPDIVCDLEKPLPFKNDSIEYVFGSHIMEHIVNIIDLMEELYRICKNKAKLFFITPYITSFDAWESPFHVRVFSENTWHYFNKRLYDLPGVGNAYQGINFDFVVTKCVLVPYSNIDDSLEFKRKHYWNVIKEMHVELEAVK